MNFVIVSFKDTGIRRLKKMGSTSKNTDKPIDLTNIEGKNDLHETNNESRSTTEYDLVPDPPDGGYGWVIVGASLILTCICMR